MNYDFAHPKIRNGMITFDEKKPDLLHLFRQEALRQKYILKTDMFLYSSEKVRIAKVQNYFDKLMVTMLETKKIKKLYNKRDIERFFREINENTEFNRGVIMNLNEAKQYLKTQGYIVERKGDFYEPSSRPEFFDPEYNAKEVQYINADEDECQSKCNADKTRVEEYIKTKFSDVNCIVNCDYDIDDDCIKYTLDIKFISKELPTADFVDDCDCISETVATALDNENIPWDDGDGKIYAIDTNGKRIADLTKCFWYGSKQPIPENLNADHFEIHELWFAKEKLQEYENEGPDYNWRDEY